MKDSDNWSEHEEILRDRKQPVGARTEAAEALVRLSRGRAKIALLEIATDEHEEETLARKAGALLGMAHFEDRTLDSAPLYDFTAAAYLGFDAVVADLQRRQ